MRLLSDAHGLEKAGQTGEKAGGLGLSGLTRGRGRLAARDGQNGGSARWQSRGRGDGTAGERGPWAGAVAAEVRTTGGGVGHDRGLSRSLSSGSSGRNGSLIVRTLAIVSTAALLVVVAGGDRGGGTVLSERVSLGVQPM